MKHTYSLSKALLVLAGACLLSGCNVTINRRTSSTSEASSEPIDTDTETSAEATSTETTDTATDGTSDTATSDESEPVEPIDSTPVADVTVTFKMNDAPVGSDKSVTMKSGNKVAPLAVIDGAGYYFRAWCTDEAGDKVYDFNKTVTSDLTLYASWNFHVFFYNDDEDNPATAINEPYIVVQRGHKLSSVPEPINPPTGKKLSYWYKIDHKDQRFDINEAINQPNLYYRPKYDPFTDTFNFYVGENKIKTSKAVSDGVDEAMDGNHSWVALPSYAETFNGNEGFKGWYTGKTGGSRFDFVDFDIAKQKYYAANTDLYARYESIEGKKSVADMVGAYKYKQYGAKVTEGIGFNAGTYMVSLDAGHSVSDIKYGVALYPTIFKGNLYSKKYVMNLKLGEFSDSNLSIQPRIYILDANGDRVKDEELYTKDGVAESSGSKNFSLSDLKASGDVDYEWNEDKYFQIGFEFHQPNIEKACTIEIESFSIFDAEVDLASGYKFDLASLEDASLDRCAPEYDAATKKVKLINDSTSDNVDNGHYCSLTFQNKFKAKAGEPYKLSVKVDSFSGKCIEGEKNIAFFIQSAALNGGEPISIGSVGSTGTATIDFSDKITVDCEFTLRINFVCGESWQDKGAGYFSDEYVEISKLAIINDSPIELTSNYNFDLASLEDASLDRCSPTYDADAKKLKLVNDGPTGTDDNGHYCTLTFQNKFKATAGGIYKLSVKVDSFSSGCVEGERNLGFFIESSALGTDAINIGMVNSASDEAVVLDFSDEITADCEFTFRINFVCAEASRIGKDANYFSNEYAEISSLSFLTE